VTAAEAALAARCGGSVLERNPRYGPACYLFSVRGSAPGAARRWVQARPAMTMIVTAMAATPAHAAALYPPLAGKARPYGV
jgi:hypothetical protein